jgi:hypothetical protein
MTVSLWIAVRSAVIAPRIPGNRGPANAACSPTDDCLDRVSSAHCSAGDTGGCCNARYLGLPFARQR